jgi:hypothetical protein
MVCTWYLGWIPLIMFQNCFVILFTALQSMLLPIRRLNMDNKNNMRDIRQCITCMMCHNLLRTLLLYFVRNVSFFVFGISCICLMLLMLLISRDVSNIVSCILDAFSCLLSNTLNHAINNIRANFMSNWQWFSHLKNKKDKLINEKK